MAIVRIRCDGIYASWFSPTTLYSALAVVSALAILPVRTAWRLYDPSSARDPVFAYASDTPTVSSFRTGAKNAADERRGACMEIAFNIDRLNAEIAIFSLNPQAAGSAPDLRDLVETSRSKALLPDTAALARQALAPSINLLGALQERDRPGSGKSASQQYVDVNHLLYQLSRKIRQDCEAEQ